MRTCRSLPFCSYGNINDVVHVDTYTSTYIQRKLVNITTIYANTTGAFTEMDSILASVCGRSAVRSCVPREPLCDARRNVVELTQVLMRLVFERIHYGCIRSSSGVPP